MINASTILSTPAIDALLDAQAAVAIGVSGGKDSQAAALATTAYLDARGHRGPRVLIHSDLGMVEWKESLPTCRQLAAHLGLELMVIRREAGGLMERWEARWASSVRRYANLETVRLVLPWSTPTMRFCTSELKTQLIGRALRKKFPGTPLLNVTGVRREESAARARLEAATQDTRLSGAGAEVWHWRPILDWTGDDVRRYITNAGLQLHRAYTEFGSSRVSCAFCIMSSGADMAAAARNPDHRALYRRMVNLEIASTFAFQGNRWLADVAPTLLSERQRQALQDAKQRAEQRKAIEAALPRHLLFVHGRPASLPTTAEAELLADVRRRVAELVGIRAQYLDAASVLSRYRALHAARPAPDAVEPAAKNDGATQLGLRLAPAPRKPLIGGQRHAP